MPVPLGARAGYSTGVNRTRAGLAALALAWGGALGGGTGQGSGFLGGPLNLDPARSAYELRLAAAPNGDLFVAWTEDTRRPGDELGRGVFVKRWTGTSWQALGGNLTYIRARNAASLDLALDEQGRPVLAWNENYGHADIAEFRAWTGQRWTDWPLRRLGQDLTYAARTRSLAARGGEPLLAWGDLQRDHSGTLLRLKAWQGGAWVTGAPFNDDPDRYAFAPSLALNAAGQPTVAFLDGNVATSDVRVKRRVGGRWQPLGGALNLRRGSYTSLPVLRLDAQGRPVVAWLEDRAGTDTLYVKRWTGKAWQQLGGALNRVGAAEAPSLALDAQGRPLVAWTEERGGVGQLLALRWTGRAWAPLAPGPLARDPHADARSPALGVGRGGEAYLAWREAVHGAFQVWVRRFPVD